MERRDKSHTIRIADAYVCVSLNVCPLANKLINILHGIVAHDIAFQWRFRMYNYNDVSFFPHFSQATNRKCKKIREKGQAIASYIQQREKNMRKLFLMFVCNWLILLYVVKSFKGSQFIGSINLDLAASRYVHSYCEP